MDVWTGAVGVMDGSAKLERRLRAMNNCAGWSRRGGLAAGVVVALGVAAGVLPWRVAAADAVPGTRPAATQAAGGSDFPFVVAFEKGRAAFEKGDAITITEVRGTSAGMGGGIYRISGTYTLASRGQAALAASVAAKRMEDAKGAWNPAQKVEVARGTGTFVLLLPVSVEGYPHVSFYAGGGDFGGVYVGTGGTVLKAK
jgi:hypothetical protein